MQEYSFRLHISPETCCLGGSLAETTESAGMLRYFAQICLQIFTPFPQIDYVQRSLEQSDGRPTVEKASFIHFWSYLLTKM